MRRVSQPCGSLHLEESGRRERADASRSVRNRTPMQRTKKEERIKRLKSRPLAKEAGHQNSEAEKRALSALYNRQRCKDKELGNQRIRMPKNDRVARRKKSEPN